MHDELQIQPADARLLDQAIEFLRTAYERFSGTIDREQCHCPEPGKDASGRPLQYFLAQQAGRVVGVAGISAQGDVGDWVVDRSIAFDRAANRLLDACDRWAATAGARSIELLCPGDDAPPEKELFARGFRGVDAPATSVRILDFVAFLAALAPGAQGQLARHAPFDLHVHLDRGDYPALHRPDIAIHVTSEGVRIDAGEPTHKDAGVVTTATAFTQLLLGAKGDDATERTLTVTPPSKTAHVVAMLDAFRMRAPWFSPLGERR